MKLQPVNLLRRSPVSTLAVALVSVLLCATPAHAVLNDGFFELDGNALDNSPVTISPDRDDWSSFMSGGTPHTTKSTGIVNDTLGAVFRNGSKDTLDISTWRYDVGSSPPKDDMLHAYAAAYRATAEVKNVNDVITTAPDDLLIYFGADRAAFSGTASLGFWFFKQPVEAKDGVFVVPGSLPGTPPTLATHSDGDTLVAFEYTNGGAVTNVRVFKWLSGALTPHALITLGQTTSSGVFCDPFDQVCGSTNSGPIALATSAAGETVKAGQFFEGGINITKLVGGDGCYSSFMATSRSSSTENAAIKNFVLSQNNTFQTCRIGISVTKVCDLHLVAQTSGSVTQLGVKVNFSGTVTNDSQVPLTNVTVCEKHEGSATCNFTATIGTLAAGASANYNGSYMPSLALNAATPPVSVLTRPDQAVFKDTAQASGTLPAMLGGTSISSTAVEASCTLCAP